MDGTWITRFSYKQKNDVRLSYRQHGSAKKWIIISIKLAYNIFAWKVKSNENTISNRFQPVNYSSWAAYKNLKLCNWQAIFIKSVQDTVL